MNVDKLLKRYLVTSGKGFSLEDHDPADEGGLKLEREAADALLAAGQRRLAVLQDMLYAQDRWGVLCIIQAMDAAGKDGTVKHVFSGLNPLGCDVTPFKAPSALELDHDFLWRHVQALPRRGHISIHNRSWYEEVLIARVHPEILAGQKIPTRFVTKNVYEERLADIGQFESYLARQGMVVRKFFLNVSREEQRQRFLSRIEEPGKNWKFNAGDVAERAYWDEYQTAYQKAIRATASPEAPWYVVPADRKWFTRLVVVYAMVNALEKLELHYPDPGPAEAAKLAEAKRILKAEG